MKYPDFIDKEMRELLDTLSEIYVPRSKRKACVKTNWSVPYYKKGRYTPF